MSTSSIYGDSKDILSFVDRSLTPKIEEKDKYSEVFTPMWFVNDMLNDLEAYYLKKYNKNIFKNESLTWADTSAGIGNFPIAIFYKLMDGLKNKIKNIKERQNHIIENMLYMAEYNKNNCDIIEQIFGANVNLYEGDSLQLDIKKEFNLKKFDIIIGNPPYAETNKKDGTCTSPLYNKFIEYYIDKCDMLSFVVPSRWFSCGKNLTKALNVRTLVNMYKYLKLACIRAGLLVDESRI